MRRVVLLLLAGALGSSALGCSGSGEVSGQVTYKKQPLKEGSITLISSTGVPVQANIAHDGTYVLKDVPSGQAKIGIISVDDAKAVEYFKKISAQGRGKAKDGSQSAPPPPPEVKSFIPEKYNDPNTSGLTVDVSGKTKHDIHLQ